MEYHSGKTNTADYLHARHKDACTISSSTQATDEFARTVVQAERVVFIDGPAAITIQEIREKTCKNATLTKLRHAIQTGLNEEDGEIKHKSFA